MFVNLNPSKIGRNPGFLPFPLTINLLYLSAILNEGRMLSDSIRLVTVGAGWVLSDRGVVNV
jgi:hypothetical protein